MNKSIDINKIYPCLFCDKSDTAKVPDENGRLQLVCRNCGESWISPQFYHEQRLALRKLTEWNRKVKENRP